MKPITLTIFLILLFSACDSEDPADRLGNVVKQQWFKDLQEPCEKNDICKTGIMQGMYLGNTVVYFTYLGGGYCDTSFFVRLYNEQGEVVKEYDETNWSEFGGEVTSYETVWYCTCGYTIVNGTCLF